MSATPVRLPHGLSQTFIEAFADTDTSNPADNASFTITLPLEYRARGSIPVVLAVFAYGAGAVGARTATYYPPVDIGSALVGIEVVSYVEATGVLTLTNRSGGALANIRTILMVVDVVE